MTLAMSGATPEDSGLASGLVNTTQQVGGALGLAVLATLSTTRTDNLLASGEPHAAALTGGYHLAFAIGAGLVIAAIALAVMVLRPAATVVEMETAAEVELRSSLDGRFRGGRARMRAGRVLPDPPSSRAEGAQCQRHGPLRTVAIRRHGARAGGYGGRGISHLAARSSPDSARLVRRAVGGMGESTSSNREGSCAAERSQPSRAHSCSLSLQRRGRPPTPGSGWLTGQDAAGRGSGPTTDRGPSGPQSLKAAKAPAGAVRAPGVGDPYFPLEGNGGYDARHYDLTLGYDPATDRLDGRRDDHRAGRAGPVALRPRPAAARRQRGRRQRPPRELQPRRAGAEDHAAARSCQGPRFVVSVGYGGVPRRSSARRSCSARRTGSCTPRTAHSSATSRTPPRRGSRSNDHPSDKATYDVPGHRARGPHGGRQRRLRSQRTRNGQSTFVWYEPFPMATYLVTADIGALDRSDGPHARWHPGDGGRRPGAARRAATTAVDFFYDTTAEADRLWSQDFGPYPFDSTGAIADNATYNGQALGFSLETQTKPVYSDVRSDDDDRSRARPPVVRRQRLGRRRGTTSGSTRASRRSRVPVGRAHAASARRTTRSCVDYSRGRRASPFWQIIVADPQRDTMFASAVYRRGGMTLQALREKIGDDERSSGSSQTWTAEHRHGNGTTEEFIDLARADLRPGPRRVLPDWLYTPGKPTTW